MVLDGLTVNPGAVHPTNVQQSPQPSTQKTAQGENVAATKEDDPVIVQKKLDPELLANITEEINEAFRIFNTAISFSVDKDTGNTIIRILDRETEKVIREIPPEEMLRLASRLTEIIGRIVDETA